MCAYSVAWNEASPVGASTNANTIDTELQDLKKSVRERMNQILDSSTAWETDAQDPKLLDVGAIAGQPDVAVVFNVGNQTALTAVTLTLLWDSETLDTGNPTTEFHSTSVNTSRMTITTAGYYRLHANIILVAGANAIDVLLSLRKNGSIIRRAETPVIASDVVMLSIDEVVLAAAADFYEVSIFQGSGVSMTITGGAAFSAFSIERLNGTT